MLSFDQDFSPAINLTSKIFLKKDFLFILTRKYFDIPWPQYCLNLSRLLLEFNGESESLRSCAVSFKIDFKTTVTVYLQIILKKS